MFVLNVVLPSDLLWKQHHQLNWMAEKNSKEYDTQLPFGARKPQGGPVVIVQPSRGSQ